MLRSTRALLILGNLTEMVGTTSDTKLQKFFHDKKGHVKRKHVTIMPPWNYIYNYDLPSTSAGSRRQLKASNVELAIKFCNRQEIQFFKNDLNIPQTREIFVT